MTERRCRELLAICRDNFEALEAEGVHSEDLRQQIDEALAEKPDIVRMLEWFSKVIRDIQAEREGAWKPSSEEEYYAKGTFDALKGATWWLRYTFRVRRLLPDSWEWMDE
jgi:hypothetical protein